MIQFNDLQFKSLLNTSGTILEQNRSIKSQPANGFDNILSDTIANDKQFESLNTKEAATYRPAQNEEYEKKSVNHKVNTDHESKKESEQINQKKKNEETADKKPVTDSNTDKEAASGKKNTIENEVQNEKLSSETNSNRVLTQAIKKKKSAMSLDNDNSEQNSLLATLLDTLQKATNDLKTGEANPELKNVFDKLKHLIEDKNSVLNKNSGLDKTILSESLYKLKDLVKTLQEKLIGVEDTKKRELLSSVSSLLKKLAQKVQNKDNSAPQQNTTKESDINDISAKIDTIIQSLNESSQNKTDSDTNQQGQYNLTSMKSEGILKKADNQLINRPTNQNFKQQMQAVLDKAKITVQDNRNATFSIKLYPKELGHININLGLEHGILQGKFIVENQEAKDLLQQNLEYIKEELNEAGVTVGEFLVDVHDQRDTFLEDSKDNPGHSFNDNNDEMEYVHQSYEHSSYSHSGSFDMVI